MNNQAFPQLSHFIKVALFGIVIEKIHAAHARVREFDGIERLFWLPKRKAWPPFYTFLFYLLCNKSSPLLCIFFEERANATFQLPHIHGRMVSQKTDKCTTNVHHPISDICYRLRRKIEIRFVTLQKKKASRNEKEYQVLPNNEIGSSRHRRGGSFNLSQEGTLLFCAIVLSKFSQVGS